MKRLREAGRVTDALPYADRDTHPELRAHILVDLARVSSVELQGVPPGEQNDETKAKIKKLEEDLLDAEDMIKE